MSRLPHSSRRYVFRPSLAATAAVAVLLPALLTLGFWQVGRGQQKARLLAAAAGAQAAPALELAGAGSIEAIPEWRRVVVHGVFLRDRQGLLDNQVRDGRVGYDILTPLQTDGLGGLLLVDRGWLARGARRSDVPAWQTPGGSVTLVGYLHTPTDLPLVTGEVSESFGELWVVPEIDAQMLAKFMGVPVQAKVLRLVPESEHGFRRDWPVVAMTPQRHYAYAVQWFGLAGALLGIFGVAGVRRARSPTGERDR